MKTLTFLKSRRIGGFSLAESMISLGIGAIAIVGGMTLSQHELRLVKSVRETNAASHALEERIEQLRLVNWRQMTDPEHLTKYYFPKTPQSGRALPDLTERVSVTAFPDPGACVPLIIETDDAGDPAIVSGGSGLDKQRLARVNVRVTWIGTDGKERVRELASIISNAGINATSLPAMGEEGTTSGESGNTGSTGSTGSTGETTPTDPGSTEPGTTDPTTTPTTPTETETDENGNGNGRGNAAGKPGKK